MNPFADTILRWWAEYGRDLPWRKTRDPYAVWLSEIILQQTRIAQGTAYWERFMARFPTVESLASASEDEVLRLWEGLGYYSRARNLHEAARQIVAQGKFPDTLEGIRALKGVGDYTAAAIGSIAFGLPAAVLDGNVYRVLGRHFDLSYPVGTTAAKKAYSALAEELLPAEDPGGYNQGLMDFGAMHCTPQQPSCLTCPLQETCLAFTRGVVSLRPVMKPKEKPRPRPVRYVYVRCQGLTAIRRRGPGDIWQGLWEPLVIPEGESLPEEAHLLKEGVTHILTHLRITASFYLWETKEKPVLPEGYQWIKESDLDLYGKPKLFQMLLQEVNHSG